MLLTQQEVVMICSYCSSQTDSVLALSCQHYICIPCAIKHSPRSAAPEITCEICGLKTAIAEQALGRLRLLATLGSADGESGTHDLASIQEALKKLDMEQHDCSRKIAKLTEVFNTSVVKIRQKFTVLRTQIDSKESALIALAQRHYKDHQAKLERLIIQIAQERQHLLDPTSTPSKVKLDLSQLSRQIEADFKNMQRSIELDINLKPLHNLVFDLELKQSNKDPIEKTAHKEEHRSEIREPLTVASQPQQRENDLIKHKDSRNYFSREDSYQRIMDKLSESKKKMNESLSVVKKQGGFDSRSRSITSDSSNNAPSPQLKPQTIAKPKFLLQQP